MTEFLRATYSVREGDSIPVAAMIVRNGTPIGPGGVDSITVQVFDKTRAGRDNIQPKTDISASSVLPTTEEVEGYRHNFYHLLTPAFFPKGEHFGGRSYRAEYKIDTDSTGLITLVLDISVQQLGSS